MSILDEGVAMARRLDNPRALVESLRLRLRASTVHPSTLGNASR